MQVDLTKLITLLLVVVGAIFLTYNGQIDAQACVALLGGALGYVFGNGHGIAESRIFAGRAERAAVRAEKEGGQHGPAC